jgi:hypothetical protein
MVQLVEQVQKPELIWLQLQVQKVELQQVEHLMLQQVEHLMLQQQEPELLHQDVEALYCPWEIESKIRLIYKKQK